MCKVSDWLRNSCSTLIVSKTICMYFTSRTNNSVNQDILINGEVIKTVAHVKYLGIIMDTHLTFKKHVSKVVRNVKFNLNNFKSIRHQMSLSAANLLLHALIFPHLLSCITTWSQTGVTTLKPVYSLYKQILKTLDKKLRDYHHCHILRKYNFLNFDNFLFYSDVCLMFKIIHGLAPPPLRACLASSGSNSTGRIRTRASSRGDWATQFRKTTFGQSAFSMKVVGKWNSLPLDVTDSGSFAVFKKHLKLWLKSVQMCNH